MKKILFLVVLYKTPPEKSSTIISLVGKDFSACGVEPIFAVWDNSLSGYGKRVLDSILGEVKYYHSGVNESLSVVYNKVVAGEEGADFFVFLDDDSIIGDEYLSALSGFLASDVPLAVPKIKYKGNIISPGKLYGVKGAPLSGRFLQVGKKSSASITAMMSGVVVSRQVFDLGVRFDERLGFYGVDTRFFIDYANKFKFLFVLDVVMPHQTALRDREVSIDDQVLRHQKLVDSWSVVFCDVGFYRFKLFFYIFYYSFKLALVRRSFGFLVLLFSAFNLLRAK